MQALFVIARRNAHENARDGSKPQGGMHAFFLYIAGRNARDFSKSSGGRQGVTLPVSSAALERHRDNELEVGHVFYAGFGCDIEFVP